MFAETLPANEVAEIWMQPLWGPKEPFLDIHTPFTTGSLVNLLPDPAQIWPKPCILERLGPPLPETFTISPNWSIVLYQQAKPESPAYCEFFCSSAD